MKEKYDKAIYGLIMGIILPFIGFFFSYLVKYYPRSLQGFWNVFIYDNYEQTQIFTFSMIPSLLLFYFILFKWKMDIASKSFVGVNLVYITFFVYLKYF